jgi:hypothetical protein
VNRRRLYPFVVGLLFGVIQTAYFFQLNFALASTFTTFLMVTLAWLLGSVLGLRISGLAVLTLSSGPWICLIPYVVTQIALNALPFRTELWPVYGLLVLVSGIFSGLFFARLGALVQPVRWLFFWENNGYLLGIMACTLAFLLWGRLVLWLLPTTLCLLSWLLTPIKVNAS